MTTRSGKQVADPSFVELSSKKLVSDNVVNDNVVVNDTVVNDNDATDTVTNEKHDKSKSKTTDILLKHVPFPHKLARVKLENKYGEFLNLLRNVSIELPFLDAMSEILVFSKFLKTLCSNGKNLYEIIQVSKEVNVYAFMIGNLPPKLADPGSFSIPVIVGNIAVDRALCDLGASVRIIPYLMYKRLCNVNELTPTKMTL